MPIHRDKQHALRSIATSRLGTFLLVTILAGLLVACAEETGPEEDRRFANDRVTVEATTTVPATEGRAVEAPTANSPGAAEALVRTEGATSTIAFADQGGFRIVQNQGAITTTHVHLADAERLLDLATSLDGTQVAALIQWDDNGTPITLVRLYDRTGTMIRDWDLSAWSTGGATPEVEPVPSLSTAGSLSWSFDGADLLATIGGKSLVDINVRGEAREILVTSRAGTLVDAAWSPDGTQIALHAISGEGTGTVWVFNPSIDGDSFHQVIPPPADAANLGSVSSVQWQPVGYGLTYILAADAATPGGQLYSLDLTTGERRVVATPGRGGPAAQIVEFTLSPDGSAVAYVIAALFDDEWQYHSAWIRSTENSAFLEVPTGMADRVDELWWLGTGFAWTQSDAAGQELMFVAQGQEPIQVPLPFDADAGLTATPGQASPAASPVLTSPDATPVDVATPGTPIGDATPLAATPGASPVSAAPLPATPSSNVATG